MLALIRIIKYAFQDMGRNLGLASMTVFILVLMLLSLNMLLSLDVVARESVNTIKNQVNASFYLIPKISEKEISGLKKYINSFPEVTDISISSREDVLTSFKTKHQFNPDVLDALSELGGNPFGPTMTIKTREPEDYKKIMTSLDVPEYEHLVESKSFEGHEDALDKLQAITTRVDQIGMGLTLMFALISFLIMFNTVRVAINTQRTEISIKRLVGANNWFIRGPYFIQAAFFTLLSVLIVMVTMYYSLGWIDRYLAVVFSGGFTLTKYYFSNTLYMFGLQAAVVLLLTLFSSTLAMRRQLKV